MKKNKIDLNKLQAAEASPVEDTFTEEATIEAAAPETEVKTMKSGKVKVTNGLSGEAVTELIRDLIGTMFKETMPAMVAAAVTAVKRAEQEAFLARQPKQPGETCQDCGQFKIACKGEHKYVTIFPSRPRAKWGKFFPPVVINGVKYLSSRPGHKVCVPKDSNPEGLAEAWDRNEEIQAEGREVEFNSGTLSGTGRSTMFQADARNHWH